MGIQAVNPASKRRTTNFSANRLQNVTTAAATAAGGEGGVEAAQATPCPSTGEEAQKILLKGEFLYSEARLAEVIDAMRADLRYLRQRHLVEGEGFAKKKGEILLTKEAVCSILHLIGNWTEKPFDFEACLPREKKPASTSEMIVTKIPFNPRTVLARFEGDEFEVEHTVDVGRNATLAIGDVIEVADHEVAQGMYVLRSPLPRDRRRPR